MRGHSQRLLKSSSKVKKEVVKEKKERKRPKKKKETNERVVYSVNPRSDLHAAAGGPDNRAMHIAALV